MRLSETSQRQLVTDNVDIYLQIMKFSVQSTTQLAALLLFFIVKYVAGVTIVINVNKFKSSIHNWNQTGWIRFDNN